MLNPFQDLLLSEGLDAKARMTMLNLMFFEKSAAIRGDRWKRPLVYRYNGRRSDLASVKEKNDDLVLGEITRRRRNLPRPIRSNAFMGNDLPIPQSVDRVQTLLKKMPSLTHLHLGQVSAHVMLH